MDVDLEILGQPYRESPSGASFLSEALEDPAVNRLVIATAWVRESGMDSLVPGLERFRSRGGRSTMILGVDLKGTTRQGLDLARIHIERVFVAHDPEGRTFHPKLYLAVGPRSGYACIGSNNLTAGGMGFNYEAAVVCTFDPRREPEVADGINAFMKALIDDTDICKPLTAPVYRHLLAEGWLADEVTDRRHRSEDRTKRASQRGNQDPLFSRSKVAKRTSVPPRATRRRATRATSRTRAKMATAPDTWWKELGAGDAQHPGYGHPTGVVRLTPPRDRLDRDRFFRRVFFADARWRATRDTNGNRVELAEIVADVDIAGRSMGQLTFIVDYGAYRNVRGRATTVLHWGALIDRLRRRELTGWHLLIERGPGSYRLRILRSRPA